MSAGWAFGVGVLLGVCLLTGKLDQVLATLVGALDAVLRAPVRWLRRRRARREWEIGGVRYVPAALTKPTMRHVLSEMVVETHAPFMSLLTGHPGPDAETVRQEMIEAMESNYRVLAALLVVAETGQAADPDVLGLYLTTSDVARISGEVWALA